MSITTCTYDIYLYFNLCLPQIRHVSSPSSDAAAAATASTAGRLNLDPRRPFLDALLVRSPDDRAGHRPVLLQDGMRRPLRSPPELRGHRLRPQPRAANLPPPGLRGGLAQLRQQLLLAGNGTHELAGCVVRWMYDGKER